MYVTKRALLYYKVNKCRCLFILTWLRLGVTESDGCLVCSSMTARIEVVTPSEHVSTSACHVSAQEFRQCRELLSSSTETRLL